MKRVLRQFIDGLKSFGRWWLKWFVVPDFIAYLFFCLCVFLGYLFCYVVNCI